MEYICTKFGFDSSSRFSFRARTHTHRHKVTYANDHLTQASAVAGVCNKPMSWLSAQITYVVYFVRHRRAIANCN